MINIPTKAEVYCIDGIAGHSTYMVVNPDNHQITHLVVKSHRPPFHEYLVPVEQVERTTPDRILLMCTRDKLHQMTPFEYDVPVPNEMPGFLYYPYVFPVVSNMPGEVETYLPMQSQNIPQGEIAVRRGARVEATDGYIGQVDNLLVDSTNLQITHLVVNENRNIKHRKIVIPIWQIERVYEGKIYLKLDRQCVEELRTLPI